MESVDIHLRSDVSVGSYLSGGLDSSTMASIAAQKLNYPIRAFTGKFSKWPGYDESFYARALAGFCSLELYEIDIDAKDFLENIQKGHIPLRLSCSRAEFISSIYGIKVGN